MGWKQDRRRAVELMGAVLDGGNRLLRRRPADLGTFLAALDRTESRDLLGTHEGRRDAMAHLGAWWPETVDAIARPDSLPEVVERRTRVRVHPAAPLATAAVAATGTSAVLTSGAAPALEVLGVVGVAVATALGAGWAFRPRPSRADRRHTVTGAPALAARATALHARAHGADAETDRRMRRELALVEGSADDVRVAESAAHEAGLIDGSGRLLPRPDRSPAGTALGEELVAQRAELVRSVLHLQRTVHAVEEAERRSHRDAYRQLLDDPLDDL